MTKLAKWIKDRYGFRLVIFTGKYGSIIVNITMLASIILTFVYLWSKVDRVDEIVIKDVFGTFATVFGVLLSLLGVFIIPRYDNYNKDIMSSLDSEDDRYYRSFVNERTEYIKKFLSVMFSITGALIGSIFMLFASKIIVSTEFGVMIIFFSMLFSIITIYITFLFIVSCFPTRVTSFRSDCRPVASWFQFWKWVEWKQFFIYI